MEFHSQPNFFSESATKDFNRFIWEDAKLWKEYTVEHGSPKYKGHLYAWYGMKPGFGYSGVWIESESMPPAIQQLLDEIKQLCPDFKGIDVW